MAKKRKYPEPELVKRLNQSQMLIIEAAAWMLHPLYIERTLGHLRDPDDELSWHLERLATAFSAISEALGRGDVARSSFDTMVSNYYQMVIQPEI